MNYDTKWIIKLKTKADPRERNPNSNERTEKPGKKWDTNKENNLNRNTRESLKDTPKDWVILQVDVAVKTLF